jgi:hypothetical protein
LTDREDVPMKRQRTYSIVLSVLALAFFLRLLGQALVAFFDVDFLPSMAQWYSGLLRYSVLLPIQLLILAAQAKISWDIWHGAGFFATLQPRTGMRLCWFGYVYFAAMVLRYVLTMTFYPERRWFTGTIPIFFHWVLAAYLFVLGRFAAGRDAELASEERSMPSP